MSCAESHLWIDDNVILCLGNIVVESTVDDTAVTNHNRLEEILFPFLIPVFIFGTGHHETTSLIIGELLDSDLQGKSLLDMGCGTSILAILARMRGAEPCTAIDIDEWCVRNSLENIELNHVDNISVFQGDASSLEDKGPFDVVIANINRNILLNDMKQYVRCMREGSQLFMSGFYVDDIPLIQSLSSASVKVYSIFVSGRGNASIAAFTVASSYKSFCI